MQVIKYVFQPHGDERGQLVALEEFKDIPFKIANVQEEIEEQQGAKIIQFPKVVNDYNR